MRIATRPLVTAATGLMLALTLSAAAAADIAPAKPDKLGAVREQIAQKKWAGAIDELKKANEPGSADWNNLMGYSLRKSAPPDYAAAEKFYDEALRIDPKHRGALEYSGELYLMTGKLDLAEQRLAALDKACFLPCEEHTDLKKSIAAYKANGNKVAVKP